VLKKGGEIVLEGGIPAFETEKGPQKMDPVVVPLAYIFSIVDETPSGPLSDPHNVLAR
jgi:hypothetical protein